MKKPLTQICSFILCIAMVIGILPAQVFAEPAQNKPPGTSTLTENAQATKQATDAFVVGELIDKRTEHTKEFLLSNGNHVAAVYADPVHYDKDGEWQEIDNTLKVSKEGAYINTAGDWSVVLPRSISKTAPVIVSRDGYTLSFTMSGELRNQGNLEVAAVQAIGELTTMTVDGSAQTFRVEAAQTITGQVQEIDTSAVKAAVQYPEVVLDKNASQLQYSGIYPNTQLRYDLHGTTLKESIILESYNATLRGYQYTLQTGELLPVVNDDGSIYFMGTGKEPVFVMKAPYLIDDNEQCSYDVKVSLTGDNGTYILSYLLPTSWLASADRAWPVILDPAITTKPSVMNTRDHTVASNGTYHYERPVLECGYGNSSHVQRIFLKYQELPALASSDVIIDARVSLYKIENSDSVVTVDVHKVDTEWRSEELNWNNKPGFDETIEDYALINLKGYYTWNVTDIVRGWYSGENTGMMFKASDQYEDGSKATWKQFASSDNGTSAWMPSLQITFRNNNGIESYWDYTASSAGRAGTGYVNSFTGNLAWIRGDMGFGGNRMPVSISHVYNLNDSASNKFGMGYGWRTNYNQLVYNWTQDTSYYVWEDSDGTSHYFKRQSDGTYKDEDGLELTLTVSSGTKTITNKNGNKSYFNSSGRLTKVENNQETKSSVEITYNSDGKISLVTDGVGRKYQFSYTGGMLNEIKYQGSGNTTLFRTGFSYTNGNLTAVTDNDGKVSEYGYTGHVLTSAEDIDGYRLEYTHYIPTDAHQPYRVLGVTEYDGSVEGGSLTIQYDHNQTTFIDAQGNKEILQFNNFGNVTSIQDDEGHAQYAAYAQDSDSGAKGNQLTLSSKLQNTVGNLLDDSSFESGTIWHPSGNYETDNSISQTVSYLGNKSLCIGASGSAISEAVSIPAGATYTFSAYVKTEGRTATLSLGGKSSETLAANKDWTRLEVSYTNEGDAAINIAPMVQTQGTSGNVYVDCVQLERAQTASRYNLVENGDFRFNTRWSALTGIVTASAAAPTLDANVYKITGNPRAENRISQTIQVSGSENDTFVLAGWSAGDSAHIYKGEDELPSGQEERAYALYGTFNYTDNTTSDAFIAHFNPSTNHWQYAAQVMIAEKAYSSIKVELVYDHNVNTVYFDGIQLYKEEFGSSYTYDEDGNVISVTDLQKQKTTYEYDDDNNLVKEILPNNTEYSYEYDGHHNVVKATTPEGQVYEFTYDTWGNNTSVFIKNGTEEIKTFATFSEDGNRLLKTTDALGEETTYEYDPDTNLLISVKYPKDTDDTKTVYTYDEDTLRVKEIAAKTTSGNSTSGILMELKVEYGYNEKDLLTQINTPTTAYSFSYGSFALRTEVKAGGQILATYGYDPDTNRMKTLAYGNGDMVEYTYDSKGRILAQKYDQDNEDTVTYTYDNNGALATVTDANGVKTTYYYDFTDRVMKYVESGTGYYHSVGYEYDLINNLTSQVETINGVERNTSYTYDTDNRVTSKQTGNVKVTYAYDGFGRVSTQTTTVGDSTILTETFTYKPGSSQIASYTTTTSTETKTYTYTYDANGNILTINDGTQTITYSYDSANQLIEEDNQTAGSNIAWSYDNAGNITSRSNGEYVVGGEVSVNDTDSYTYGNTNWGDLLTAYNDEPITYDAIGNPIRIGEEGTPQSIELTWRHGRQLASLINADETWSFTYNADGLRTKRTNGSTTYEYIYNGSQLTAMTVGDCVLYFSYDAAGIPMSVSFNGTEYFYTSNIQGDVTGLVNSQGQTVVTYTYDAWGNQLSCTGSMAGTLGVINPLRYRGYVYDQEIGYYYLQSRYYNPEIGRFINADGLISTGQGLLGNNMFAYCGNNPVTRIDPLGFSWISDVSSKIIKLFKAIKMSIDLKNMGFSDYSLATARDCVEALSKNGIDTPDEKAHFFSQCYVESRNSLLEAGYLDEEDAEAYRKQQWYYPYYGAGYIQLTGESNYRAFSEYMGDPLIYSQGPKYVAKNYAWCAAGWWWTENSMNALIANGASVADVTFKVNNGTTHLAEREAQYNFYIEYFSN